MEIQMNKKYRTTEGQPVRIICTDRKTTNDEYCIVGLAQDDDGFEFVVPFDKFGNTSTGYYSLVEVKPYEHINIDDKVWVRNHESDTFYPKHFAGLSKDDKPLAFVNGKTSHTTGSKISYDICLTDGEFLEMCALP